MPEEAQLFQRRRNEILALVDAEVERYVNENAAPPGADSFPEQSRLTGEFYIGGETYAKHLDRLVRDDPRLKPEALRRILRLLLDRLEFKCIADHVKADILVQLPPPRRKLVQPFEQPARAELRAELKRWTDAAGEGARGDAALKVINALRPALVAFRTFLNPFPCVRSRLHITASSFAVGFTSHPDQGGRL